MEQIMNETLKGIELPIPIEKQKIPGTYAIPTSGKENQASKILASQGPLMSSQFHTEAIMLNKFVKLYGYFKQSIKTQYKMRFLASQIGRQAMIKLSKVLSPMIQDIFQKIIIDKSPETITGSGSMLESVVEMDAKIKLRLKCEKIQDSNIRDGVRLQELCDQCGEWDEDYRRVQRGEKRKCPLSRTLPDIFGDMADLPTPNTFEPNITRLRPHWYIGYAEEIIYHIRVWRSISYSWHTHYDDVENREDWRKSHPIGQLITYCVHEPILRHSNKIIDLLRDLNELCG